VKCGNREEARSECGEIAEAVAISQTKRIDGQTATSFLFATFSFEGKEKVGRSREHEFSDN
jgi:hypothetical protein